MSSNFSIELAQIFIESDNLFPVSLDEAWKWIGYAEKRNALRFLRDYFEEGVDFVFAFKGESSSSKRSTDLYLLTVDCFKELGMLAKTEKGKQVRKYFLECERLLKEKVKQPELSDKDKLVYLAEGVLKLTAVNKALTGKIDELQAVIELYLNIQEQIKSHE